MKKLFNVMGMSCAACSAHVDKAVRSVHGVSDVSVNLLANSMTVIYDDNLTNDIEIINAVIKAGYSASLNDPESSNSSHKSLAEKYSLEYRRSLINLFTSIFFLLILMYVGMGKMLGLPLGLLDTNINPHINVTVQMILAAIIIGINFRFYKSGFTKLLKLAPNMDSLVALGSAVSYVYSVCITISIWNTVLNSSDISYAVDLSGKIFFESSAMILVFVSIGKTLEAKSKVRTRDSIEDLMKLKPETATRLIDGKEEVIPISDVHIGDIIVVRSGQQIPADGVIRSGSCSIDESVLTGESIPVDKILGDNVYQATINRTGYFEFEVTKSDSESALSEIIRTVEEAASSKAPISRLADKISSVFVPVVIGLSLITFFVWLLLDADFYRALNYAISVVVISCPCSLGLATPTAITVGTGKAAKLGILFKSAAVLENCHDVDTVVLDKTGTITTGELHCPDDCIIPSVFSNKKELLILAGSAQKASIHPIGRCIYDYCVKKYSDDFSNVTDYEEIPGGGISCKIDNKVLLAGNINLISEHCKIDESSYNTVISKGATPILFCLDDRFLGIIGVEDTVKHDSKAAVEGLRSLEMDVYMLTGDTKKTATQIASKTSIDNVISEVKPQDKEAFVTGLKEKGHKTAMIGDGINDAPALTSADVGIAIGTGTDIAIDSADVILTHGSLIEAVNTFDLSRKVMRNIKQNLFWAFFYNCLGIPVAAGVFTSIGITLNPMISAALMSCSSLFVVSNALRLNLYKPKLIWEDKIMKIKMVVEGMMCMHCQAHVEKALNGLAGITATVDLESKTATIEAARDISDEELTKAVTDAGYEVVSISR